MSKAENPGNVKFSYKKYYSFRNKINKKFRERFHSDMMINMVMEILQFGDTQPCVVVSVKPLRVAAYSDEMDAVVMLNFPDEFAEKYDLAVGSRLTSSNIYYSDARVESDIFPGSEFLRHYSDFLPVVQLFIGKNDKKIEEKTALFPVEVWDKVEEMGKEYLEKHGELGRFGFYYFNPSPSSAD